MVQTVSAVGYATAGLPGGLLAAVVAFSPSFAFVLGGGVVLVLLAAAAVGLIVAFAGGPLPG